MLVPAVAFPAVGKTVQRCRSAAVRLRLFPLYGQPVCATVLFWHIPCSLQGDVSHFYLGKEHIGEEMQPANMAKGMVRKEYDVRDLQEEKSGKKEEPGLSKKQHQRNVVGTTYFPQYKDHIWRCDVEMVQTADCSSVRRLNIFDEYTRECLRVVVSFRISSQDVMNQLFNLFLSRGVPKYIRTAGGLEATANALRGWLYDLGIKVRLIGPGMHRSAKG